MLNDMWNKIWEAIRRYFAAGLLAFAPIAITVWAIAWIIGVLDNLLLPHVLALFFPSLETPPEAPPLVGAIFTFLVILVSGVIVRHLFGHQLVKFGEHMLSGVPVARSIYGAVKQLFEAIVASSASQGGFSRVVLIEYPRPGLYGLGFVTGSVRGSLARALPGRRLIHCFVPTTPNPTSGFYLLVPEEQTIDAGISVEDAFKLIMSAGLVGPHESEARPQG